MNPVLSLLTELLKIAPQLGGEVFLVACVIILFYTVINSLIRAKLIEKPPNNESAGIIYRILFYMFLIAFVVIILSFASLILSKALPQSVARATPKLFFSFSDTDNAKGMFGDTPVGQQAPSEAPISKKSEPTAFSETDLLTPVQTYEIEAPSRLRFQDVSPDPNQQDETRATTTVELPFPFVVNLGHAEAKGIWFRLHVGKEIGVQAVIPDFMDYSNDQTSGIATFILVSKNINLAAHQAFNPAVTLPITVRPEEKTYQLPYEIGAKNAETSTGEMLLQIKTSALPPEYVENERGLGAMDSKQIFEAKEHFERAIKLNDKVGGFFFNLGVVVSVIEGDSTNRSESIKKFQTAISLEPTEWRPRDFYGEELAESGNLEKAEEVVKEMLKRRLPPYRSRSMLLTKYLEANKPAKCIQLLEAILHVFPDDAEDMSDLGGFYIKAGRLIDAKVVLEHSLQLSPDDEVTKANIKALEAKKQKSATVTK